MKNLFSTLLVLGYTLSAFSQSFINVPNQDLNKGLMSSNISFQTLIQKNTQALNKFTNGGWFNYLDSAVAYGKKTNGYSNTFIFPDSFPKQVYGDGMGGVVLQHIGLHGAGEVFDFKCIYFNEDSLVGYNNSFTWDSLSFGYFYNHIIPNSVDTLIIQYFYNGNTGAADEGIVPLIFNQTRKATASIDFDPKKQLGKKSFKQDTILLTSANNTNDSLRFIKIAVGGKVLPQKSNIAFFVKYIPGYDYSKGDTLDSRWNNPVPTKKINNFRLFQVTETPISTFDRSYNWGIFLYKFLRYSTTTPIYVFPGNASLTQHEHILSSFYLSPSLTTSLSSNQLDGFKASGVCPNPSATFGYIDVFMPHQANASISIANILGKKVSYQDFKGLSQGKNTLTLPIASLQNGVYLYTIQSGSATLTGKFTVNK